MVIKNIIKGLFYIFIILFIIGFLSAGGLNYVLEINEPNNEIMNGYYVYINFKYLVKLKVQKILYIFQKLLKNIHIIDLLMDFIYQINF